MEIFVHSLIVIAVMKYHKLCFFYLIFICYNVLFYFSVRCTSVASPLPSMNVTLQPFSYNLVPFFCSGAR